MVSPYTSRFNRRAQSFFPHLFSGRYKSLVVAESRSAWGWELAAI